MDKKNRVLNVLIAGHAQAGKSSLIEAMVGVFPDYHSFELSRGTTISLKVIQFELKKQNFLINFLDSPGHADFKGSIALGLEFADLLVLVVSSKEGFQARTYWLFEKAMEKQIPIIVAATKMDLPEASVEKISAKINEITKKRISIILTSSKNKFGMEELIGKITIYVKKREKVALGPSFIILGFNSKKGIGEMITIGLKSGQISKGWLTNEIKIRQITSMKNSPLNEAQEGDIVNVLLNVGTNFKLGTRYKMGKFIPPSYKSLLSEIKPRKEFDIKISDPQKHEIALEILEGLKKIVPSFDYFSEKENINIMVLGDFQFEFIREKLEDLIEIKVMGSKIKGVITINASSKGNFSSAKVRIIPRFKKTLTISRMGMKSKKIHDILGASAAFDAFHLDGLHVDIYSGKNEDEVAQAIVKAIEKVKLIKIVPHQDVMVKIENFNNIFSLIEKYDIEILHQTLSNSFFLQVKNEYFDDFFNSLMKISKGRAKFHLFKFERNELVLSVDPGTRHIGFSLIERKELPALWNVNFKHKLENSRTESAAKTKLKMEMDIFLDIQKDFINKIFVGNGPGSKFIIDFFIDYFGIPCENYECLVNKKEDFLPSENKDVANKRPSFRPPQIYIVDEYKTTKEAMFHLQNGKLINEVKSADFVDHAIAALLIAKRGIKGEVIKIEKKPIKQFYDYILENYAGSNSFSTLHVNAFADLKPGMYLRVKDSSKLDSNLKDGDVVSFLGFDNRSNAIHATTLSGNKIIIKFQGDIKIKKDFFKVLIPVKKRN